MGALELRSHSRHGCSPHNHPTQPQALKPTIETEEVYTSMVGQGGATPAELFDKFVDALQDRFAEDKRRLRDFLPRASPVAPDWAYEDFVGRIEKALVGALGVVFVNVGVRWWGLGWTGPPRAY